MSRLEDHRSRRITNLRNFNETLTLGNLWQEKPCALFFLRRLGCSICRNYIQQVEVHREFYEKQGYNMVALSFESFGEGSDTDRSFEKGGFWKGPIYKIHKDVYENLFGRKKLMDSFYGLLDMDKTALQKAKNTPGNFKGDGFQLGGQFIVAQGGRVILDHRQKVYGDDAELSMIVAALCSCQKEEDMTDLKPDENVQVNATQAEEGSQNPVDWGRVPS